MPIQDIVNEHDVARRPRLAAESATTEWFTHLLTHLHSISNAAVNGEVTLESLTALETETNALSQALASDQNPVGDVLTSLRRCIDIETSRDLSSLCAPSVVLPKEAIDQSVYD